MSEQPSSDPAFPQNELNQHDGSVCVQHTGLTMRDYFAARAMESILSTLFGGIRLIDIEAMAEDSYKVADAMLKARTNR